MKTVSTLIAVGLLTLTGFAQDKKQQDKEAIKEMCGCYRVTFDYAETFANDTSYEKHDAYHAAAPAEWIFVDEETDDKIVLQHLLVINDTMIVKHWRQDWVYENNDLYMFEKNASWNYEQYSNEKVDGQWSQKVYQVDDSPRYEGSATWVHVDGKHYWENTTDAPLPRREKKKRSDYNVMTRTNRHALTDYGWVHEQDNLKVIRKGGEDSVLVAEKGMNRYMKIDESNCEPGKEWWKENGAYWRLVRAEWQRVFDRKQDIDLVKKVDDKMLWQSLFALGDEMKGSATEKPKEVRKEIASIIDKYMAVGNATGDNNY